MLFSAGFTDYKCTACEAQYSNISPTSILPIGFTCVVAGGFWSRIIRRSIVDHWTMNVLGFVVAFLTLWGIYIVVDVLTTSNLRSKRCPKCSGELKIVGGGFYDGITPNPWELLVYLLTIAVAYGAMVVHKMAIASG